LNKIWVEAIGWTSTVILLVTLMRQVYTEWKSNSTTGLSRWLFIGQLTASLGFLTYSLLLKNWVFAGSNFCILLVAVLGQTLYSRNKNRSSQRMPTTS